ncbi:MAG: crotonase/enoyl-CoA hydratase family protein [Desulfobacteraceae bacterium]|nr:crotonase/enoyl-CoA hydratase family protein [Desulfobacteraceae bacterium]
MNDTGHFDIRIEGHVAWLVLNRPESRNTLTPAFFSELTGTFTQFAENPRVRVIVIRAEGKSFCAGLDMNDASSILSGTGADERELLRHHIEDFQESFNAIETCRKPVIAAVHGHCIGGGLDMICACDIRLATEDAVFSVRETRLAIVADLGVLQRLPHLVGYGLTNELAFTGRDFSATEALDMKLINRLCRDREQLLEEAMYLAGQIADNPPLAVQGTKDVIRYSRDNGVGPGLSYAAQKNAAMLPSEDLMEAVRAFMEKRKPEFTGK